MTWEDIDTIRKERGLSKRELSRRAGYTPTTFGKVLLGERHGSEALFCAVCRVLGVDGMMPWGGHE